MRFASLSLVCLWLSSSLVTRTSCDPVVLEFGADFTQDTVDHQVAGKFTVVDQANFITGLNGNIGNLATVQWRYDDPPTVDQAPPTAVYIKVLRQHPTDSWRFTQFEQRLLTVRPPTGSETYTSLPYTGIINDFWNSEIDLQNIGTPAHGGVGCVPSTPGTCKYVDTQGFHLKTPDPVTGLSLPTDPDTLPPAVLDNDFIGFYFPNDVSVAARNTAGVPAGVIEWSMPGNFDWPFGTYSPDVRFDYPVRSDPNFTFENVAFQQAIVGPHNQNQADAANVPSWWQYTTAKTFVGGIKQQATGDPTNKEFGYVNPATNAATWVQGFMARRDHKDYFRFTVTTDQGFLRGDPQFAGFQNQNFQFHGMADEVFNLISTPTFQMNGNFKYLSTGNCNYNDTACWSHPGTYVDQLGFLLGDSIRLKLVAGAHGVGLQAYMNDVELRYHHHHANKKIVFAINNGTDTGSIVFAEQGKLVLDTPTFNIAVQNADYFFNLEVVYKDHEVLRAGRKQVKLRELFLCAADGLKSEERLRRVETRMADYYPRVQMHGLIGQTWRNALICNRAWVGDASDYVTSDLFAADSAFNYYGTKQ